MLALVAVPEQVGSVVSDDAVSPFLKPLYSGVMAGAVLP